ncbi:conserved hypothetical protein [Paecilomyces variotii No. 5]|uniref:DUF7719 domain-containing protein n=1 Tax=Byssochlamys spectabilis (strain No. 5 / NBRC 109023) TaxID=1356009 RepID=V5G5C7_BYSSN|nr:conserved hypothetical protein [Paecilomyces variotii No. 5]
MDAPRNRRQRRAAAAAKEPDTFDSASIPLARPPPPGQNQKTKTLLEIAEERQRELYRLHGKREAQGTSTEDGTEAQRQKQAQFMRIGPDGNLVPVKQSEVPSSASLSTSTTTNDNDDDKDSTTDPDDTLSPLIDTLLLSIPLSAMHFTLSYLAAHQYAQDIPVKKLVNESLFAALPVLTFLIHLSHGHIISFGATDKDSKQPPRVFDLSFSSIRKLMFPPTLRTLVFLPLAVALGAKLVALTNEAGYYAVMKRAPSIGTLWVWSILELSAGAAAIGVIVPLAWGVWWMGYTIV